MPGRRVQPTIRPGKERIRLEFIAANWLWIVFVVAMIAMHRGGGCGSHGSHGGHSTHDQADRSAGAGRAHHEAHR